jgi:hypothetical protein
MKWCVIVQSSPTDFDNCQLRRSLHLTEPRLRVDVDSLLFSRTLEKAVWSVLVTIADFSCNLLVTLADFCLNSIIFLFISSFLWFWSSWNKLCALATFCWRFLLLFDFRISLFIFKFLTFSWSLKHRISELLYQYDNRSVNEYEWWLSIVVTITMLLKLTRLFLCRFRIFSGDNILSLYNFLSLVDFLTVWGVVVGKIIMASVYGNLRLLWILIVERCWFFLWDICMR